MLTIKALDLKWFFLGISNENVLRVINYIAENPNKSQSDIVLALDCHQPSFSRWISTAKKLGVINEEHSGVVVSYTINEQQVNKINEDIENFLEGTNFDEEEPTDEN